MPTLFDPDVMSRLERLELLVRKQFAGERFGNREMYRRGGSVEFADHRPYAAGDDLRYIDWNVYGRLGTLFLKQFEAQEDVELLLFLDRSRSMEHPSPAKLQLARLVVGALGYIGLAHLDSVRLVSLAGASTRRGPPLRGKGRAMDLLEMVERVEVTGEPTDLLAATQNALGPRSGRGVAVLVTDFYDARGIEPALRFLRARRYQVVATHIVDRDERAPPLSGRILLEDSETGRTRKVTITSDLLNRYQKRFDGRNRHLERHCAAHQVTYARVSTEQPFDAIILHLLRRRGFFR